MAYTANVSTPSAQMKGGQRLVYVTITETEARDTSEFSITGLPKIGTIVYYKATLTAGTGGTIQPKIGRAASFAESTQNHVGTQSVAKSHHNDTSKLVYSSPTGTLYIRSWPNRTATNHAITTEVIILAGVE